MITVEKHTSTDLEWISHERFANSTDQAGHLRTVPELVLESPLLPGFTRRVGDLFFTNSPSAP
jgi:hypothetical protein